MPLDPAGRTTEQAIGLFEEFQRTGDLDRLNAAVDLFGQSVDATPPGHPNRARYLSNLGAALRERFGRAGQAGDLDAAITAGQEAVDAAPAGRP